MTDFGAILQTSVTLAGFLIAVNAYLPKGLEEEWFAFTLFLVPAPVLFLATSILAVYNYDATVPMFALSTIVLLLLFIGLGLWSNWEKYTEHRIKEKLRTRNPALYAALTRPSNP